MKKTSQHKRFYTAAVIISAILCLAALFSGCGNNQNNSNANASEIEKNPENYVTLGKYKGIEITVSEVSVSDKEVQQAYFDNIGSAEKTDEIVASLTDYKTVDEYLAYLRSGLEEQKKLNEKISELDQIIAVIKKEAVFSELIDGEIQAYIDDIVAYYADSKSPDISLEEFINTNFSITFEEFNRNNLEEATESVQNQAIIYAIGKAENIVLTDEIYNERVKQYAEKYSYTVSDLEELITKEALEDNIYRDLVYEFLLDNAVVKA